MCQIQSSLSSEVLSFHIHISILSAEVVIQFLIAHTSFLPGFFFPFFFPYTVLDSPS